MKEANERGHFREERGAHCTQPLDQALDSIRSPRTKHWTLYAALGPSTRGSSWTLAMASGQTMTTLRKTKH